MQQRVVGTGNPRYRDQTWFLTPLGPLSRVRRSPDRLLRYVLRVMNLSGVTALILTFNEEANIERTLGALGWVGQIVVVDSGSTDRTREIVTTLPSVTLVERPFDSHAAQWNFGLTQVGTDWTLALDADHVCPPDFANEIRGLASNSDGYEAGFTYVDHGRPLRTSLYPPRVVLFKTKAFRYVQDGHTQRLVTGAARTGRLNSRIAHDDRKSRSRWFDAQRRYAVLEAARLVTAPSSERSWTDHLRQAIVCMPVATPFYCLFARGLILDGWPGLSYTLERTYAELLLSMELVDRRLSGRSGPPSDRGNPAV